MIKNKKIKAYIIGACILANSMMMVYADGNGQEVIPVTDASNPAVVVQAEPPADKVPVLYTTAMQQDNSDPMAQKQQEVDKILFEERKDEIAKQGFSVAYTLIVGDQIEIGIEPYSQTYADYLYEIFGENTVDVVAANNPEIYQVTMAGPQQQPQQEQSKFIAFFVNIWEWIKGLF